MKKQITLRIDEDVVTWFKSQGKGYQSAMNDALRDYVKKAPKIHKCEYCEKEHDSRIACPEYIERTKPKSKKQIMTIGIDPFFRPNLKQGKKVKK